MRHTVKVRITPDSDSVVKVRQARLRERLARRIFGRSDRYAVLVPGGSVDEVTIRAQATKVRDYLATQPPLAYSDQAWNTLVDHATVTADGVITILLKDELSTSKD